MQTLPTLTLVIGGVISTALMTGCQTTTTTQATTGPSQKEVLLAQSGSKVKMVTTQKQKQHVNQLPAGKVPAVKYNGKVYFAYPTANKDKVYVGTQAHYHAYKKAGQQQMAGDVDFATRTVLPHRVEIEQFDRFTVENLFGFLAQKDD